ncbi:MAG: DNA-binding transcriptional regulator Fis [Gammaproteobacteria bacterium]|nr:DNA-binding transcriptional regulator Fis [Gammaproteobacteria bacterium]NIR97431.1 DNA-binding transcriptional regulator Fis [Gammaproteobacteria bacterium]
MSSFRVGEALVSGKGGTASGRRASLSQCVREAVEAYFADLNGHPPANLYEMVIREVEKPLLSSVMQQVQGNQTRAAQMLGINRSTLRKKLIQYELNG